MAMNFVQSSEMFEGRAITGLAKWRWATSQQVVNELADISFTLVSITLKFVHKIKENS